MMVAWSKHTGEKDRGDDGAVRYFKDSWSMKRMPDGRLQREERDPAPEILRGHPDLVRRVINSLSTKHVYASGVLSFYKDDLDVTAFNRGDVELRTKITQLMDEFEDVMFHGVPKEMRSPIFWTTHTHTGRLELNVLAPRFVYSGKPDPENERLGIRAGKTRAFNPHPPGRASRQTYDAFRRLWNVREGWADPDDDSRARLLSRPDHHIKQDRARDRAGGGTSAAEADDARDPRDVVHQHVLEWVEADEVTNRDELLEKLRDAGYQIKRSGKEYISILTQEPAKNTAAALPPIDKPIRLKGVFYSEAFTDEIVAIAWMSAREATEDNRRKLEAARRKARWGDLDETGATLKRLLEQRAAFNRSRYGGPAWEPSPGAELDPLGDLIAAGRVSRDRPPDGSIRPLTPASQTKARIWKSLYAIDFPHGLAEQIRFVSKEHRTVRFNDGSVVEDKGTELTGTGNNRLIAQMMALEAKAKGWSGVSIEGSPEFVRGAVRELMSHGIVPFGVTDEVDAIVAQKWSNLGGGERTVPTRVAESLNVTEHEEKTTLSPSPSSELTTNSKLEPADNPSPISEPVPPAQPTPQSQPSPRAGAKTMPKEGGSTAGPPSGELDPNDSLWADETNIPEREVDDRCDDWWEEDELDQDDAPFQSERSSSKDFGM